MFHYALITCPLATNLIHIYKDGFVFRLDSTEAETILVRIPAN